MAGRVSADSGLLIRAVANAFVTSDDVSPVRC
jgi:hypothetical protein